MSVKIKTIRNVGEMNHRHGDIGLVAIDPPTGVDESAKLPHLTLAQGRSTGHSHRLVGANSTFVRGHRDQIFARETKPAKASLYQVGGRMLLDVRAKSALVHDEHGAIFLARGWWEVVGDRNAEIRKNLVLMLDPSDRNRAYARFLEMASADVIHEDTDAGGRRRLLSVQADGEALNLLECVCVSKGDTHYLMAPSDLETCGDVVAWTFGFTGNRRHLYRPLVEA